MFKKDARKNTPAELRERRHQVLELYENKMPIMQIVKTTGLSWQAVNTAIKLYKSGGVDKLLPQRRGKSEGDKRLLTEEKAVELITLICRTSPVTHKIKAGLWDRQSVQLLIKQRFDVELSSSSVAEYMNRFGFALKPSKKKPLQLCQSSIQSWLETGYPEIQLRAEQENATILWANRIPYVSPYPIGNTESLSLIYVVNNQGKLHWKIVEGRFDQSKQHKFLQRILRFSKRNVFVIRYDPKVFREHSTLSLPNNNRVKLEVFPGANEVLAKC